MSTKQSWFYFSSSKAAPASPSYSSAWVDTGNADRRETHPTYVEGSNWEYLWATCLATGTAKNVLNRQYVSLPLIAQTVSGTFNGQLQCKTNMGATLNFLVIKLVSNSGSERTPYLYQGTFNPAISTGYYFINRTLTGNLYPSNAQSGDRLVFEFGFRASQSGYVGQCFGDPSGVAKLPIDNTSTGLGLPFVEFSQYIDLV